MLRYHVRSRDLVSIVSDLRNGKLIKSPYFQRNLVWRDVHKKDFIETILLGLPFPQIFIAQGEIDVETLESRSVVVDGQQRTNAIKEFVDGLFSVNGKKFNELGEVELEEFLRYQIPVIDLELKASDPQIIDIFKRLNRTFYALSAIEKMSTEYATVDLMLIAKYACGILPSGVIDTDTEKEDEVDLHPLMPEDFLPWAAQFEIEQFQRWLVQSGIFTEFEIARSVHLMFCLNILSTVYSGFFPRNEKPREYLEAADEYFPFRDELLTGIERAAAFINKMGFDKASFWLTKSNAFTLFVLVFWNLDVVSRRGSEAMRRELDEFSSNVSEEYALAAREAVNNRKQRVLRHELLASAVGLPAEEKMYKR
ncbi:hypothetical protein PSM7751_03734 [Pseudooceanicola marinus]|uniref:GmrSD restriction endonucleases N-terminal domain-containing protein n=1 Tax=Pseudooceanicola marinus TaxID=396013 RepID=A0A1X7A551_9RHOB|nr:DUF262 domain-containing protein [Pseudooceanicola marinus]PJE27167.1 DUF262 domain-containing protein [Pseudooceanicola marinus]SLN70472.1 hypothetical protein PSM7751_03734 [Pseudooceanicola marinus]